MARKRANTGKLPAARKAKPTTQAKLLDDLRALIAQLTTLRRRFPQTRPRHRVEGQRRDGSFGVLWLTPKATEMTEQDWNFPEGRFLAYVLGPVDDSDEALFVVLNAVPQTIEFWHDRPFRLHDRVVFSRDAKGGWNKARLYP